MAPTTKPRESRNSSRAVMTEMVDVFNDRLDRVETDFVGHLKKVEDRLDQLVDLTKSVALLQQQTNQQTEQLSEVRSQVRENAQKFENSITRVHGRFDDIKTQTMDKLDIHSREIDIKIKSVETQASNTDKELKQWLNRGWGIWALSGIVLLGVQGFAYRGLDSLEKERVQITESLATLTKESTRISQQVDALSTITKDNQTSIKRLDQVTSDTDRQLEILRNRK